MSAFTPAPAPSGRPVDFSRLADMLRARRIQPVADNSAYAPIRFDRNAVMLDAIKHMVQANKAPTSSGKR